MNSSHILSTGLRCCYDEDGDLIDCRGSGQDAAFLTGIDWPLERFETCDDHLVLDRATGLIWTKNSCPSEFPLSWQEALDFVEQMNQKRHDTAETTGGCRIEGNCEALSTIVQENLHSPQVIPFRMYFLAGSGHQLLLLSPRGTHGMSILKAAGCFTAIRTDIIGFGRFVVVRYSAQYRSKTVLR